MDAGDAPNDWQADQTGKIGAPQRDTACGISGTALPVPRRKLDRLELCCAVSCCRHLRHDGRRSRTTDPKGALMEQAGLPAASVKWQMPAMPLSPGGGMTGVFAATGIEISRRGIARRPSTDAGFAPCKFNEHEARQMQLFPGLHGQLPAQPMKSGLSHTDHRGYSRAGPVGLVVQYRLQGMRSQPTPYKGAGVRSSIGFEAVDDLPGDRKPSLGLVAGHG